MPLLLNDPCENFTFGPWTTGGAAAIVAALHANGFSIPSGTTNTATYDIAAGSQTDTISVGFNIKWSALSPSITTVIRLLSDAGVTVHNTLSADNTGALYVTRSTAPGIVSSAAGLIVTGTWYYVELTVKLHDTAGTVTLRLNGAVVASGTGLDTKNAGTKAVYDSLQFRGGTSQAFIVDDVYIRNDNAFGTGVTIKTWTGSAFADAPMRIWNGSAFVDPVALKTWNGSAFV
jgi:hypothetical protein